MNENLALLNLFEKAKKSGLALATVVRVTGSSYRRPGAKMLVTEDGEVSGSVSGGCLERDLIQRAIQTLKTRQACVVRYDTRADAEDNEQEILVQTIGLGCEGIIDILIEPDPDDHRAAIQKSVSQQIPIEFEIKLPSGEIFFDKIKPPQQIVILGAGPDVIPMVEIGHALGWASTVVDFHSAFPVPRRCFAHADRYITASPEHFLDQIQIGPENMVAVMTHNYEHDQLILSELSKVPQFKYLGLLGPKTRGERLLTNLKQHGLQIKADHLHFPMGLDLGGENAQSIALSAFAEMQAILSARQAGFLKNRLGSIHDPGVKID